MHKLIVAGGCFWGVEAYFKQLKGVIDTSVGYANGTKENPTYEEVCTGAYQFVEACEIIYDDTLSLKELFDHLFRIINPYAINKQGGDVGIQYRTGIYYETETLKNAALDYILEAQKKSAEKIVVEVKPIKNYYKAESYHQDYLDKNPTGYCHINLDLARKEEKK